MGNSVFNRGGEEGRAGGEGEQGGIYLAWGGQSHHQLKVQSPETRTIAPAQLLT